jgi:hypothetical protein
VRASRNGKIPNQGCQLKTEEVFQRRRGVSVVPTGLGFLNLAAYPGLTPRAVICRRFAAGPHDCDGSSVGRQRAFAFGEEGPGFFVGFEAVAIFAQRDERKEHDGLAAARSEEKAGRDEIPDILRDNIRGEEVDFGDGVIALAVVVGFELAEVSGAGAAGGGLDLHAQNVESVIAADVVGGAISPRLGDAVSVGCGARHKL